MIKVSRRLNYGLQLMICLAEKPVDELVPTSVVAEELGIPLPFLHQIAHTLMQSGLIKATPGPRGGLHVGNDPAEITLLQIFESLEGVMTVPAPITDSVNAQCFESQISCRVWEEIGTGLLDSLKKITLAELAAQKPQTK